MKKVCFFGIFDPLYARNRVLIKGFKDNNWEIIECNVDKKSGRFKKYILLFKKGFNVRNKRPDLVIVSFPGHLVVPIARLIFGKKFVFDAFTSLYNSDVEDRRKVPKLSLRSLTLFLVYRSVAV
jgi:hypothetical protein